MELNLKDKVVLVCGASTGLGYKVAEEFAKEKAKTIICSGNEQRITQAADSIHERTGSRVYPYKADLSVVNDMDRLLTSIQSRFKKVDILVNNTGGPPAGYFMDFNEKDWLSAFNKTFISASYLTRQLLPEMIAQKWGRIINLTSISVKQPVENLILSNSIRPAIIGWAKTLANQYGKDGITINNIATGLVLTDRLKNLAKNVAEQKKLSTEQVLNQWAENIPVRRLGKPEDIAWMVLFLASEKAGYISGATISVDGGDAKGIM